MPSCAYEYTCTVQAPECTMNTVLLLLNSSSHCLPNFCQKFTRGFPVFTKSGVPVLTADWYWYHPCSCALCGLPKVYSWIATVYLNSELRFPVFTLYFGWVCTKIKRTVVARRFGCWKKLSRLRYLSRSLRVMRCAARAAPESGQRSCTNFGQFTY